jgi:hypothetical protein
VTGPSVSGYAGATSNNTADGGGIILAGASQLGILVPGSDGTNFIPTHVRQVKMWFDFSSVSGTLLFNVYSGTEQFQYMQVLLADGENKQATIDLILPDDGTATFTVEAVGTAGNSGDWIGRVLGFYEEFS